MRQLLYGELVAWYRLLDPPADHADEAAAYQAALERAARPSPQTLLELGSGAGHNALHLKKRFDCTLSDPSPEMLALSRELNPECAHHEGDMRTLRLGQLFDTVLVHDAVVYMTNRSDLRAAMETAWLHLRPGGAAIFAPDDTRENFVEATELIETDDGSRSLRCMLWSWDPDPSDDTFLTEYSFLLREGAEVRAVHDRHVEGLFSTATWTELLEAVGFEVELIKRPIGEVKAFDRVFLGVRR